MTFPKVQCEAFSGYTKRPNIHHKGPLNVMESVGGNFRSISNFFGIPEASFGTSICHKRPHPKNCQLLRFSVLKDLTVILGWHSCPSEDIYLFQFSTLL